MKQGNDHQHGFTLMELIMVITIMAIMVGTIVPNFSPFMGSVRLKHAANHMAIIFRYARSIAIEKATNVKLQFNLETNDFMFMSEGNPLTNTGTYTEERLPQPYPREYKENIKIAKIQKISLFGTEEENEITFSPNGASTDTFIYMVDVDERVYTVGIIGLTGQVLVWDRMVETFYEE